MPPSCRPAESSAGIAVGCRLGSFSAGDDVPSSASFVTVGQVSPTIWVIVPRPIARQSASACYPPTFAQCGRFPSGPRGTASLTVSCFVHRTDCKVKSKPESDPHIQNDPVRVTSLKPLASTPRCSFQSSLAWRYGCHRPRLHTVFALVPRL